MLEFRVLARPAPTIYLTTLQEYVDSMRAHLDSILEIRVPELDSAPVELADVKVLTVMFTTTTTLFHAPRERVKRHRSSHTTEGEDAHAQKKE